MKNRRVQEKLLAFLKEYASGNDLYWYPLTELKKDIPVVAYDLRAIYRSGEILPLQRVFDACRIDTVMTFQTDSMEYFEDDRISELLFEKSGDGYDFPWTVETFYFDQTEKWLVYVSHEGTLSFTGEEIVLAARKTLPDKYLYL